MRVARPADWPEKLAAAVEAARDVPFTWGTHDCCTFAAGWVQTLRGLSIVDVVAYAHGPWSNAVDAARVMRAVGGLSAEVTSHLGAPIAPALAMRGDVVRVEVEGRESLAIVVGDTAAAPGEAGIAFAPMPRWLEGWEV